MEVWTRRNWGVLTYYSQNWKIGKKDLFSSNRKKKWGTKRARFFNMSQTPEEKEGSEVKCQSPLKKRKKIHLEFFSLSPLCKGENSMRCCCFQFGNVSAGRKRIHYVSSPPWPYLWVCMSNVADVFMGKEDSQHSHKKEHQQEWFPAWQMGQMSLRKRRTDFHFFPFREVGGLFRQVIRRETKNAIQRHGASRKKVGKPHCVITKIDADVAKS